MTAYKLVTTHTEDLKLRNCIRKEFYVMQVETMIRSLIKMMLGRIIDIDITF